MQNVGDAIVRLADMLKECEDVFVGKSGEISAIIKPAAVLI